MITNELLKHYSLLKQKRHRLLEQKFLVEGTKLVAEGIESWLTCEIIFMSHEYVSGDSLREEEIKSFTRRLRSKNIRFEIIKNKELQKLTETETPQGIVGVFNKPPKNEITPKGVIIGLENISDPGNVGTILRNCDWFGFRDVAIGRESADLYNSKVIRSSMGAVFHLNIIEGVNLPKYGAGLKHEGYRVFVADLDGLNLSDVNFREKKILLVLCNEASGPSLEMMDICDCKVTIPRFGKAESLNVASASAILLAKIRNIF